ncbi:poly-gamma-glutamate synthesis protein (capsule biosynthesis protein) [Allocatelliglobosispora scoriae]|uniref:Poly-gamma-glutamate synthesis protein (Capsule biosynthesis protein) n=1 Tax=Allocatelliglobosispora scoriae TaxID=643052 RepID=A0A841BYY1_9ACTN|nr:CapA family protein [Allocatelliglobosispora scoriae]MBB5872786.1 poly-gamma-glutamate synthesis protein (capsule biosynthesis protein) [Allocatelliglobosispora scoriae]
MRRTVAGVMARRRARLAVAALTTALLSAACTSTSPPAVPEPVWSAAPSPSLSAPAPTPAPSQAGAETLTLAFGGDVHFTGRTARLLRDPGTVFGAFAAPLRAADVAVVNLETAVTTRGTPEPKEFHFRTPASAFTALTAAGIDIASLGNNHALDYGRVGLADSLAAARSAGVPVIGAGATADEAYAAHVVTVRGVRVAVLAMSQIHTLAEAWAPTATRSGVAMSHDRGRAVQAVKDARAQADVVVVFMHWGVESSNCPKAEMTSLAKALAAAGANIITGTHAHVPLAGGMIGNTYVHYGAGNFVWYVGSSDTLLLTLTVSAVPGGGPDHTRVVKADVLPGVISSTGQPKLVTGSAASAVKARLAGAQRCSGLKPGP